MAYAALLSLAHTIDQALHCGHQFLIPDEKQKIRYLLEKVTSLLDFFDRSPQMIIEKEESLESEVIDVAYKAEDIIESHIMNELLSKPASQQDESFTTLSQNIDKVMREIVAAMNQVMKLRIDAKRRVQDKQQSRTSVAIQSSIAAPARGSSATVGADDDFRKIKLRLTGGASDLQIVSIYGMGGIGKTTIAQKVYNDASVKLHFDYCAWVTVSQDFTGGKILLGLLGEMHTNPSNLTEKEIDKFKDSVHKNLKNRRYLVVMDDVWDNKAWDEVKRVLPNDCNGSRIILTTRLQAVASYPELNPHLHPIDLLDEDSSWKLFCENVFGKDPCPSELEGIGINLVQQCRGLPLAIIVIGGLVSKLPRTQYEWGNAAENLEDLLSNSNDEHYSKIWTLSYYNLPHHLKGCFLYMGIFPEDFSIRSSVLIKLWVAEGLIKPVKSRNLEEVAVDYLRDLTERSLVSVAQRSSLGEVKTCKIHDVLRDFCLNEAERLMLFHVSNRPGDIPDATGIRRFSIHEVTGRLTRSNSPSIPLTRSVLELFNAPYNYPHEGEASYPNFLRILHVYKPVPLARRRISMPALLRYIFAKFDDGSSVQSVYECQYLQTFILQNSSYSSPDCQRQLAPEFWKMVQLRHVQSKVVLNIPDPPSQGRSSTIVLENLQTLSIVNNFRCTVEVLERIPNLQKLGIYYGHKIVDWQYYCLNSLDQLRKLEALTCIFKGPSSSFSFLKNVTFPKSLKKLTLVKGELPWKHMEILSSLCNLRVLKLKDNGFSGRKWKVKEGNFPQLEFLLLDRVYLVHWIANNTCFQNLQRLVIKNCRQLRKIPSVIGETSNLQSIELHYCSDSLIRSAKEIEEEQRENFGNEIFQLLSYQLPYYYHRAVEENPNGCTVM